MGDVVVVGSLNCDLVMRVARLPAPGETVPAAGLDTFVGGKGCNQAIAAARAGASVAMVGRVGRDAYADLVLASLRGAGVDASGVLADAEVGTGVAQIFVDDAGANMIGVAPRANAALAEANIAEARGTITGARTLLLQLEIRPDVAAAAARLARAAGGRVILNPAPIPASVASVASLIALADVVVPNETEAAALTDQTRVDAASAPETARRLRASGARAVVITLGASGAFVSDGEHEEHIPAFAVTAVDSTAAGDAFCGALAAAWVPGVTLARAVRWANAAGALACTRFGAEPSLPLRSAIEALAGSQGT
jgi:ribokinase